MPTELTDRIKWDQGFMPIRVIFTPEDDYYRLLHSFKNCDIQRINNQYTKLDTEPLRVGSAMLPSHVIIPSHSLFGPIIEALNNDDFIVFRGSATTVVNLLWGIAFIMAYAAKYEDGANLVNRVTQIAQEINSREPAE